MAWAEVCIHDVHVLHTESGKCVDTGALLVAHLVGACHHGKHSAVGNSSNLDACLCQLARKQVAIKAGCALCHHHLHQPDLFSWCKADSKQRRREKTGDSTDVHGYERGRPAQAQGSSLKGLKRAIEAFFAC